MGKTWKLLDVDNCPRCGDAIEVFNDLEDGYCYDGDEVRCVTCGEPGSMVVDEGAFYVFWPYTDLDQREYNRQLCAIGFSATCIGSELWGSFLEDTHAARESWTCLFEYFTME